MTTGDQCASQSLTGTNGCHIGGKKAFKQLAPRIAVALGLLGARLIEFRANSSFRLPVGGAITVREPFLGQQRT